MSEFNSALRAFAEERRYPTRLLEDGERVVLGRRHRRRRGWWALEEHRGGLWWAFYLDLGERGRPGAYVRAVRRDCLEDASSTQEVYFRVPEAVGRDLMEGGPAWCRVTPRRSLSPAAAAAAAANLRTARLAPKSGTKNAKQGGEGAGAVSPASAPGFVASHGAASLPR